MPDELEDAGSSPACPTNAKAMCGAWLGAYALPGRLDPANLELFSLTDTPERRGRGGRNPATKGPFFCVLVRRSNRKAMQRQKPSGSVMARRTRWEWFPAQPRQVHSFSNPKKRRRWYI